MRVIDLFEADDLDLPTIAVGDTVLIGKFKNRRAEVTGLTKDDHNQPVLKTTKGDTKLFKPRIAKLDEGPAWHGSPHHFMTFDITKVGTGEGHDAFGWGIYFASAREVADYYKRKLSNFTYKGKPVGDDEPDIKAAIGILVHHQGDKAEAKDSHPELARQINKLDYKQIGYVGGHLYEVELPDDASFLSWDLPFKQQSLKVRRALRSMVATHGQHAADVIKYNDPGEVIYAHLGNFNRNVARVRYERRKTSLDLLAAGIAGIKYLDADSRTEGDGSFNYVVFDSKLIKIVAIS